MYTIQSIINYLVDTYGFEVVPCSIPKNYFQYQKRNFYIFILRKVSERLFFFLKKVSPIKYLDNRPDGSFWLCKRVLGRTIIEIVIEKENKLDLSMDFWTTSFIVSVLSDKRKVNFTLLPIMAIYSNDNINRIDKELSKFDTLKKYLRDKKLKLLL